jgi:hypothetical protein
MLDPETAKEPRTPHETAAKTTEFDGSRCRRVLLWTPGLDRAARRARETA